MAKNTKRLYLAKGKKDTRPWLFYGEEPPIINKHNEATSIGRKCIFAGGFNDTFIKEPLKDNEIIQISIRKIKTINQ